jgi:hypothetical protein
MWAADTLHEFSRDRDVDIRFSPQTELARRGELLPWEWKAQQPAAVAAAV